LKWASFPFSTVTGVVDEEEEEEEEEEVDVQGRPYFLDLTT